MKNHLLLMMSASLLLAGKLVFASDKSVFSPSSTELVKLDSKISCSSLKGTKFEGVGVEKIEINKAEVQNDPFLKKEFCLVEGRIAPEIRWLVKLPIKAWSQRFVQVGCGGYCGTLNLRPLENIKTCAPALNGELVISTTNMGHDGGMSSAEWGDDPQKRIDFADRAQHLTAVVSKILLENFYGHRQKFSYFVGCSDGGREALIEAQRFPEDFDGIIAGAPALNLSVHNSLYHGWNAVANTDRETQESILQTEKLKMIHEAILEKCDALDGVKDRVINTPWNCKFDFNSLLCKSERKKNSTKNCLDEVELKALHSIYNGPSDPKTKSPLSIGQPLLGSELEWKNFVQRDKNKKTFSYLVSESTINHVVNTKKNESKILPLDLTFSEETFERYYQLSHLYDANSTDLEKFENKGGKLILWHGLNDTDMAPFSTVSYFNSVEKKFGAKKTSGFIKLYLLPGAGHCGNGQGPSNLELLNAMMSWVENKVEPDRLIATLYEAVEHPLPPLGDHDEMPITHFSKQKFAPKVIRSRPVYPYPRMTVYKGTGNTDDAENFDVGDNSAVPEKFLDWYGNKVHQKTK